MIVEEHFDECPYTGKPCRNAWDCANCEIETVERLWADDLKFSISIFEEDDEHDE